jgi:hypothetical protein
VNDVSGVAPPLNLTIATPANTSWIATGIQGGALSIDAETLVQSGAPASKIITACMASNELTFEAWVSPGNDTQDGPARVLTCSVDPSNRNFTMGQDGGSYQMRIRTTTTGNNGGSAATRPVSAAGSVQPGSPVHIVCTRDTAGVAKLYLNGVEVDSNPNNDGDFSNWDANYEFGLANEFNWLAEPGARDWLGEYYLVAVYSRALTAAEVQQNYNADAGAIRSATRSFNVSQYVVGQKVRVAIDLVHGADTSVVVTETFPDGWIPLNISDGGTSSGNTITWNLASFTADTRLTYEVYPLGGNNRSGLFDGTAEDGGGLVVPIAGATEILRAGTKPIVFLWGTGGTAAAEYDDNVVGMIGSQGLDIDGTFVNGLGYAVERIEAAGTEEQDDYTADDTVLIFQSQTATSGDFASHTFDPVPMLNTEQALNANDPQPRSEMYFAETEGATAEGTVFEIEVIDVTHPITSHLAAPGLVRVHNHPVGELGQHGQPWATGAQALATLPGDATNAVLMVAEAGATPMDLPDTPPEYDPVPARRASLGFHEDSMASPTVEGAVILQRTVQWCIGDAVTAGSGAPDAPTNLTASQLSDWAQLDWTDASDNENGFVISRKDGPTTATGEFVDVGQVTNDVTSFVDQTVVVGSIYTYHVRAFNPDGESADSNEAEVEIVQGLRTNVWYLYR